MEVNHRIGSIAGTDSLPDQDQTPWTASAQGSVPKYRRSQ